MLPLLEILSRKLAGLQFRCPESSQELSCHLQVVPIGVRRHGDAVRRVEVGWVPWETPSLLSARPRLAVQWPDPSSSDSPRTPP